MMKRILLLLVFLMLPATACAGELATDDLFQPIPMSEVLRHKDRPGTVLLDLNDQDLWSKHHIRGAVHVTGPDLKKFLPKDKTSLLIFYCAGPMCRASADAANQAFLLGFRRVYVMTDGIFTWVKAGYPVESTASKPQQKKHASHGNGHH